MTGDPGDARDASDQLAEAMQVQRDALMQTYRPSEALDPELADWVVETPRLGLCLKHPLVFQVPFHPALAGLVNDALKAKREWLAEYAAAENWKGWVWAHERPYRHSAFGQICEDLDDKAYWQLLRDVWMDTENFYEWADEVRDLLYDERRVATRAEFFMTDDERASLAAMDEEFTVYRGFCVDGAEQGWSWTIDRARAEWFAQRFAMDERKPQLAVGKVARADVVAFIADRGEEEIVVDPDDVFDITVTVVAHTGG